MHLQSNSLAERMVQTIRKSVAMCNKGKKTFDTHDRFVLNFKSIPHFGKSQLMKPVVQLYVSIRFNLLFGMFLHCMHQLRTRKLDLHAPQRMDVDAPQTTDESVLQNGARANLADHELSRNSMDESEGMKIQNELGYQKSSLF